MDANEPHKSGVLKRVDEPARDEFDDGAPIDADVGEDAGSRSSVPPEFPEDLDADMPSVGAADLSPPQPGLDGYYHICGFSGHGFMLGPVSGKRMARYITTGEPDDIISSLSLDRFENGDIQADAFVVG